MASTSANLPRWLSKQGSKLTVEAKEAKQKAIKEGKLRSARKHARKQAQSQDGLLRRAVELYHLTPAFFPMPARTRLSKDAPESSDAEANWLKNLDNTIHSSILNTDVITRRTPNLIPRGLQEYARIQSNRSTSVPPLSVSTESASHRHQEAYAIASDLTRSTFMTQRERERQTATPLPDVKDGPSSPSSTTSLSHFTDQDIAMYQRRHQQHTDMSLDSTRYSGAQRPTHLERMTAGTTEWYGSQNLDTRSARIRDAIFGTVSGELPGLDIVRERFAQMRAATQETTDPDSSNDKPITTTEKANQPESVETTQGQSQ